MRAGATWQTHSAPTDTNRGATALPALRKYWRRRHAPVVSIVLIRGRAMEVLRSGDDIPGDLAGRDGVVKRPRSGGELDQFADRGALRIVGFDKQATADIRRSVDIPALTCDVEVGAEWGAFLTSAHRLQAQQNLKRLMERELQTKTDVERRLPFDTNTLAQ